MPRSACRPFNTAQPVRTRRPFSAPEGEEEGAVSTATGQALVARNPNLATLERMVADGSCAVLSLDIFDTILWRRVPRPTDVFAILGGRLKSAGVCPEWLPDAAFRRMRIVAEQDARRARGSLGSEVSLFDIWEQMPLSVFQGATLEDLVAAEVRAEREFTVVDLDVAEVIRTAQKHDVPIVLVSDTYFTEDQLGHLLDRPELGDLSGARVFRSHEHGLDKGSGLFEIVLEQLGARPEQLVHMGDNLVADIETAEELGIRTVHYERVGEELGEILDREQEWMDSFGHFGPLLDPENGDFGLTSLRAKTLEAGPYTTINDVRSAWRFGAGVLGPVLTGFAEWVAQRAHETGRSVVWCPMREGTVLSALINNAADARGWDVEARPLWLSRHVASLAALDPVDPDQLEDFLGRSYRLTVRQLLVTLGLRVGEVPALAQLLNHVLDNEWIVTTVRDALLETPHLRNRLSVTATRSRERLMRELRRVGALDGSEIALVDLGWGGTIQYYLSQALRGAGTGVTTAGFYLATDHRSHRVYLAGEHMEGFLGAAGHPHEVVGPLVRSPEVIEQCVNDFCGSLVGFADDGSPVLGSHADSPSQEAERRAAQEGFFAFQRQWYRYVEHGSWPTLTGAARERLARILVSAMQAPTSAEAALFGKWGHEDNFGSSVVTHLVPDDLVPAIPYMSPADLADLQMRDAFWPALIAASDAHLAAGTRALTSGHVERGMFEMSEDPADSRLSVQDPEGTWNLESWTRVRINHNGLSFARLNFGDRHGLVTGISLAVPGRPAIVRVDWIEFKGLRVGSSEPEIRRWEEPGDFAGLALSGATWLGGNMFEFDSQDAGILLNINERAGAPFSSGQVTVAFAMLPKARTGVPHRLPGASKVIRMSSRLRVEYKARGASGLAGAAARVAARKLRSGE
jgi:FMN phosphatase YigB (HAD superfamily)